MTLSLQGKTLLISGVVRPSSIATTVATAALEAGGRVILTAPAHTRRLTDAVVSRRGWQVPVIELDVTRPGDLAHLPAALEQHEVTRLDFLLHAIAYAPTDLLGDGLPGPRGSETEDWQAWMEALTHAFTASVTSLPALMAACAPLLGHGSQVAALTFESERAVDGYGWMGPLKAALEACVRRLAVEYGPRCVGVNAISAGPIATPASSVIPGFEVMRADFERRAPLGWNGEAQSVATTILTLASGFLPATTGQIIRVDGGAHLR